MLADDAYRAYFGEGQRRGPIARCGRFRCFSPCQPTCSRAGSGIRNVGELKGQDGRGRSGRQLGLEARHLVLKAFDVEQVNIKAIGSREVAVRGLQDGTFDAIMLPGACLSGSVHRGAASRTWRVSASDRWAAGRTPAARIALVRVVMIPRDIYPGRNRLSPRSASTC